MQDNIKPHVNVQEFEKYLSPFVKNADNKPLRRLSVIEDEYEQPAVVYLKTECVLILPWNKDRQYNYHTMPHHTRHSYRYRLYVSNNGNLYIERQEQNLYFNIVGIFSKRLKRLSRNTDYYVYKADGKTFRKFVLELKRNNMLTEELKNALVRDG